MKDKKQNEGKIYILKDPIDGSIRYVGQTRMTLAQRLALHVMRKDNVDKAVWIDSLIAQGKKPIIELVEICTGDLDSAEMRWLKFFQSEGHPLLNRVIDGKMLPVTRQRLSEAKKGMIAVNKGVPHTPQTREKIKQAMIGRVFTAETLKRMSDARKAYWERRKAHEAQVAIE